MGMVKIQKIQESTQRSVTHHAPLSPPARPLQGTTGTTSTTATHHSAASQGLPVSRQANMGLHPFFDTKGSIIQHLVFLSQEILKISASLFFEAA